MASDRFRRRARRHVVARALPARALANTRHLGRGLFAGFALEDAVTFQAGARLEAESGRIDDAILALREELSRVEDVDIAEAVMALELHEAGYEAALAAFARARQPSLLDFLR